MKVKTLNEKVAKLSNEEAEDDDEKHAPEAELDYDELNRNFYLIGGPYGWYYILREFLKKIFLIS